MTKRGRAVWPSLFFLCCFLMYIIGVSLNPVTIDIHESQKSARAYWRNGYTFK